MLVGCLNAYRNHLLDKIFNILSLKEIFEQSDI